MGLTVIGKGLLLRAKPHSCAALALRFHLGFYPSLQSRPRQVLKDGWYAHNISSCLSCILSPGALSIPWVLTVIMVPFLDLRTLSQHPYTWCRSSWHYLSPLYWLPPRARPFWSRENSASWPQFGLLAKNVGILLAPISISLLLSFGSIFTLTFLHSHPSNRRTLLCSTLIQNNFYEKFLVCLNFLVVSCPFNHFTCSLILMFLSLSITLSFLS